jgi:hypothetical protein
LVGEFSLSALSVALETQRQARGFTWAEVLREMNGTRKHGSSRQMAVSTVSGAGTRRAVEGDGVLQMLRWLGRSPESFVPGLLESGAANVLLPDVPSGNVLRFDTKKLHAALDTERASRGLSWAQVARQTRMTAAMLTHLAAGGRTGFPHVMRMTAWLGRPAAEFTRASDW